MNYPIAKAAVLKTAVKLSDCNSNGHLIKLTGCSNCNQLDLKCYQIVFPKQNKEWASMQCEVQWDAETREARVIH